MTDTVQNALFLLTGRQSYAITVTTKRKTYWRDKMINMPTKTQMDQAVNVAAEVVAEMLNVTKTEALTSHVSLIEKMVCMYAATECQ